MNSLSFCIVAMCICACGCAQNIVALSAGANVPIGEFASATEGTPGFAKTGMAASVSFEKKLYRNLGLTATMAFKNNPIDKEAVKASGDRGMHEVIGPVSVACQSWRSWSALLGPHYTFKLTKDFALTIMGQAGLMRTAFPDLQLSNILTMIIPTKKSQ